MIEPNYNYYESCGFRLPCGICTRTHSTCPLWRVEMPVVTWATSMTVSTEGSEDGCNKNDNTGD